MVINLSSLHYDFSLTRCRPLLFYVLLKTFLLSWGIERRELLIFQSTKVDGGTGGQLFLKKNCFDVINVCLLTDESEQLAMWF